MGGQWQNDWRPSSRTFPDLVSLFSLVLCEMLRCDNFLSASDLREDLPCKYYMNVIVCTFLVLGTAGDPWKVERKVSLPGKTCPIAHMPKCAPWINADWTNLHWSFDQHLYSCSGGRDPHKVLQFYSAQLPHNRCRKDWTRWKRLAAGATALRVTDFASVPIVWFQASKSCDRENYKKSWR